MVSTTGSAAGSIVGMEQLVELIGLHATDGGDRVDPSLVDHGDRNANRGEAGAFGGAGLEHPEPPSFDGELEILGVVEVILELRGDGLQVGDTPQPAGDRSPYRRGDAGSECPRPRPRPGRWADTRRPGDARRWRDRG